MYSSAPPCLFSVLNYSIPLCAASLELLCSVLSAAVQQQHIQTPCSAALGLLCRNHVVVPAVSVFNAYGVQCIIVKRTWFGGTNRSCGWLAGVQCSRCLSRWLEWLDGGVSSD
jgi:hypothetical protein